MSIEHMEKFEFRFLKFTKEKSLSDVMLRIKSARMIYKAIKKAEEERAFVKAIYDKTLAHYFLYLDFIKYVDIMHFNKQRNCTFFFL